MKSKKEIIEEFRKIDLPRDMPIGLRMAAIEGFILKALFQQKVEFKKVVWEGAEVGAEKAYKLNWLNKKDWFDDQELSSSIAGHILKALKKL